MGHRIAIIMLMQPKPKDFIVLDELHFSCRMNYFQSYTLRHSR